MNEKYDRDAEIQREAENWLLQANTKPRHTIELDDGRQLEFYTNARNPEMIPAYAFGNLRTRAENAHNMYTHLAERGVVVLPEVEAKDSKDYPLPTDYAVYVDSRIGRIKLFRLLNMVGWSNDQDLSLARLDSEVVPADELAVALDRGIEETGIGEILEQMCGEAVVQGLDRSHIISAIHDRLH